MLTVRRVTKEDPAAAAVSRINEEAFPPVERIPLDEMLAYGEKADAAVWGFFEDALPAGFALTLRNGRCVYISYFAIRADLRGRGLGGEALRLLLRQFPDRQPVLDMEPPDPEAENHVQRERRRAFYLRNGFRETGRFTMLRGIRYAVLCAGGTLDAEGFAGLVRLNHLLEPDYSEILY